MSTDTSTYLEGCKVSAPSVVSIPSHGSSAHPEILALQEVLTVLEVHTMAAAVLPATPGAATSS